MAYKSTGTLNLKRISTQIRDLESKLGRTVVNQVAKDAAVEITVQARASYDSGTTVYGDARPEGKYGPLSLVATGMTRNNLRFVAVGTRIRTNVGGRGKRDYRKYLIGKYKILPIGNAALPYKWLEAINRIVDEALRENVGRAIGRAA
jgi:hypothetical protein